MFDPLTSSTCCASASLSGASSMRVLTLYDSGSAGGG